MVGMKEAAASTISHTHIEGPMNYTGMMDCFMKTVRYEGFGALFKVGSVGVLHANVSFSFPPPHFDRAMLRRDLCQTTSKSSRPLLLHL
jgi:hypothetical protein